MTLCRLKTSVVQVAAKLVSPAMVKLAVNGATRVGMLKGDWQGGCGVMEGSIQWLLVCALFFFLSFGEKTTRLGL